MRVTIYIPDTEEDLYKQVKEELDETMSATVVNCWRAELQKKRERLNKIVVGVHNADTDTLERKAFTGRWLIGDETTAQQYRFSKESGVHGKLFYSVAWTAKQKLAVFTAPGDNEDFNEFEIYESFEEFRASEDSNTPRYPDALIAAVAKALGVDHIEHLDI